MVLAALLLAAAVAAAPPDGTYKYTIEQTSTAIGSATVSVKRADVGIQVHETQEVKLPSASRT